MLRDDRHGEQSEGEGVDEPLGDVESNGSHRRDDAPERDGPGREEDYEENDAGGSTSLVHA